MKGMKRGCLLWLLQLAVVTGLYYLVIRGRLTPPKDVLGALGGGLAMTLLVGGFRHVWLARKGRALLDRALTGAPFEDGQRIAAIGPILALGAPIEAPFSGVPCVACSWSISREIKIHTQKSNRRKTHRVNDFAGFTMTPCVVQTPTGNVRILGFPVLEEFPEQARRGNDAFARARAYLQSASFEKIGGTNVFSQVKDLVLDEDSYIHKDWRMAGDDFQLDPGEHILTEEVVEDGQTVCALGLYSAERKGLVPGYGRQGDGGLKLIQGDAENARSTLMANALMNFAACLVIFLVAHYLLVHWVLIHKVPGPAELATTRKAALFQAISDEDLAAVTAELDVGVSPNVRDPQGNTPLMLARDPRITRRLIEAGADVNARNEDAATPLIEAAKYGRLEVVRLLLQAGADVNAQDISENRTALDWAIVWDSEHEVVTVLRNAGAREGSP